MKNGKNLSALLMAVLSALQFFLLSYLLNNASITSLPISMVAEMAAAVAMTVAAVLLFAKEGPLSCAQKRGFAASAVMYVVFAAFYWSTQLSIIQYTLSTAGDGRFAEGAAPYCVLAVKALLLIAAVLAAVAPEEKKAVGEESDASAEEAAPAEAEEEKEEPAAE